MQVSKIQSAVRCGWLLCSVALAWMQAPALVAADAPARPNVLLIAVDDLNCNLGCYGHSVVQSPNIDRLAARSVRFDRAYCQFPLCAPSRASFLSGRRPESTRVLANNFAPEAVTRLKDTRSLPEHFQKHGYVAARVGKIWGQLEKSLNKPWDLSEGPSGNSGGRGPQPLEGDGADEADALTARRVVELLERKRDKPFFIAAGFLKPHEPFRAPAKFFDLYPLHKVPLRPGARKGPAGEDEMRRYIAGYCAATSFMDAQLGVVLGALERLKLWDHTVVVFLSDHGFQLGEHNRWSKPHPFEECCRVPLLIAAPGKRAGVASPRLVELVDVYPTLVQLCALPMPEGLEGTSLLPLLDDPSRTWKKAAFTTVGKGGEVSIRTERYRYIADNAKRGLLFDHRTDTLENIDVSNDPAHAPSLAEIQQLLRGGWRAALPRP